MPRTLKPAPRPIIACIPKREACKLLGNISDDSFEKHWQSVFTDKRPENQRGKGSRRMVFEDELREACANGGGVLHGAKVAVLNYRRLEGRR